MVSPSFTKRQQAILYLLHGQSEPVAAFVLADSVGVSIEEVNETCETLVRREWIVTTERYGNKYYRLLRSVSR